MPGYRSGAGCPATTRDELDPTPIAHRTHGLNPNNLNKYDARIAAIDYTSPTMTAFRCAIWTRLSDPARCFAVVKPHQSVSGNAVWYPRGKLPFIADDMDNLVLPAPLKPFQHKLFGLIHRPGTTGGDSVRNVGRTVAMPSLRQCRMEVAKWKRVNSKNQIPWINSTTIR